MKPAYYQNYCIDSNQILHNTKDNQVLIVRGTNTPQQTRNSRQPSFWKKVKSPYLRSRVTAFNEIWYGDAYWHAEDRQLKFWIFIKSKTADGRHLENRYIAICRNPFARFGLNLARWRRCRFAKPEVVMKVNRMAEKVGQSDRSCNIVQIDATLRLQRRPID